MRPWARSYLALQLPRKSATHRVRHNATGDRRNCEVSALRFEAPLPIMSIGPSLVEHAGFKGEPHSWPAPQSSHPLQDFPSSLVLADTCPRMRGR